MADTATRRKPSHTEIATRVRGMIAEKLGVGPDSFPLSATIDNLDLDSLDAVELLMDAEESFDVDLRWEDAGMALTVGAFIDSIEGALATGGIS